MESLSGPQYQDALLKVGLLCELRHRNVPDEDIATKLQFGSIEAMHTQLVNWDLPDWIAGAGPSSSEPDKPERCAGTTSEEPTELPPAYAQFRCSTER